MKERWCSKLYRQSHKRAAKSGMPFNITRKIVEKMWEETGGCCSLTGLPFDERKVDSSSRRPFAPSIDRIDRRKGYTRGNTRLVCVAVNMALFTWGEEVFDKVVQARCIKRGIFKVVHANEGGYRENNIVSKGRVEGIFKLCTGWFVQRERRGLPVPPFVSEKKHGSGVHRTYNLEDVALFFKNNKDALRWRYENYLPPSQ